MILFFDWEVFYYDNVVVCIEPLNDKEYVFANDLDGFREYWESRKDWIWCGYNCKNYDQWITRGALLGLNLKKINDFIIVDHNDGWRYTDAFRQIHMNIYDCMPSDRKGLKALECFMGSKIKESDVDFNLPRKLTDAEIEETIQYCRHDVEQTIEVFTKTIKEFNSQMSLINTFKFPLSYLSKTQAQLTAMALDCRYVARHDEWDIVPVPTLKLDKYAYVRDWFLDKSNHNYSKSFETVVCGIPHIFGWGGLHGASDKPIHRKGLIIHVDVNLTTWVHNKTH